MRTLERNKRAIWYSLPDKTVHILDEWGNDTGETEAVFSEPIKLNLNVSAAVGQAAAQAFGMFTDYSRTITAEKTCPLVLGARIWYNNTPPAEHNYTIVRVADGLDSNLFALREVATSGN